MNGSVFVRFIGSYCVAPSLLLLLFGCGATGDLLLPGTDENSTGTEDSTRYLYVASGSCYGGGVTVGAGQQVISKYNLSTGERVGSVLNYFEQSPNDQPIGLVDFNETYLMTAVENTLGRRIDLVRKDGLGLSVFVANATILSAQLRSLASVSDGGFLVSKGTAVEKVGGNKQRVTAGANPYINAPTGPGSICATSTTLVSSAIELQNGMLLYGHAAATPNNKIGLVKAIGTVTPASDCVAAQAGPTTTARPTHLLEHSSGKILVSYGSTTAGSNSIYSYDVSTTAITGATLAYQNLSVINGPSAMTEDRETGEIYIANATVGAESIEKFTVDATTGALTRVGATPFIPLDPYVKCVSGMVVAED